ncbi:MAG: AAA family ATPase [Alphaproteobacteria bacterium]|nr:AAA family ATPase [Alphaproteobacteria bacterium]
MIYLDAIRAGEGLCAGQGFPFDLPMVRALEALDFDAPVTFLVGENGSGKSTLLEAIAAGMGCVAIGSADIARDPTLEAARALAAELVFVRRRYPRTKTFFRAEDAFGFTKRVIGEIADLEAMEEDFRGALPDGSWGQQLAMGVARDQRGAYQARYGEDPDGFSHGETFLGVLKSRLTPKGLYLLDEPETPLSPTRILALLSLLMDCVTADCQFIIATHSPILMALPDARILHFDEAGIAPVPYDDIEHVAVTRAFLNDPKRFLRRL